MPAQSPQVDKISYIIYKNFNQQLFYGVVYYKKTVSNRLQLWKHIQAQFEIISTEHSIRKFYIFFFLLI